MNKIHKLFLITVFLLGCNVKAEHQPFQYDSLTEIESNHKNQPFLLIVWSLECPPCRGELELVSQIKKQYPKLNLAFISTDNINQASELNELFSSLNLPMNELWAFNQSSPQRLRYGIDKNWYGEMPRSYFYNSNHERVAVSGKLSKALIIKWIGENFN